MQSCPRPMRGWQHDATGIRRRACRIGGGAEAAVRTNNGFATAFCLEIVRNWDHGS